MKYLLPLILLLQSCGSGMNYKKYLVWYEGKENPLRKTETRDDIEFNCTYMLADYFRAREMAAGSTRNDSVKDESEYYKLNIKIKDGTEPLTYKIKSQSESYERINYYVSSVKDDVLLATSSDTLSCQMHHYERVYHVGNTLSVMFIFDKTNEKKERTIAYYDKVFGKGLITFHFTEDEIKSIPKLIQ